MENSHEGSPPKHDTQPEMIDLLVAGAGGGLAGALRAGELGLQVLVVEVSPHFTQGNNTSMSTAMIPAAGTRWQEAHGIVDSPEQFLADIMAKTHGTADPTVANALVKVGPRLVTWLADWVGLPLELATDIPYPGHSAFRCHTIPGRNGARLLGGLLKKLEELPNVDLLTSTRLVSVHRDEGHLVARVEYPNGTTEEISCRNLLLATNGFGANTEMVQRYIPEIANANYHGSAQSRGDAIRIGESLGARCSYLDAYQGHGALTTPHSTLLGWATVMHGAVLVNREGLRFGDETSGYSEYAAKVLAQTNGEAYVIFDRHIYDACQPFDDFQQSVKAGAVRWGQDANELAIAFDIDSDGLTQTLQEVQHFTEAQATDNFGRSKWPHQLQTPLACAKVTGALFHTQGGLVIDGNGRVLQEDDTPIIGLYASGGSAIGISGHGASGYLAGNGLLPALGLAYLAGEHIALGATSPTGSPIP